MRSINKVILIGNLTRDPEMRQTPQGQSVCTFSIATNREWVTTDNRKEQSVEFHDCVAWARLAEVCDQYLKKGKLVYIEGHLKTRSWDTPEGLRNFKTEIVVQDMIMLEKRPKEDTDFIPAENADGERLHQRLNSSSHGEALPTNNPVSIESDLGL
ncbi:MAG: Single-stranded DNA-binding protein [Candidatus Peregrinibacteria bacterium GW2011_GWA2_47_7]|nr:MAG: Single-stranded DNA-binding protein [Candidatus Peregrinibacteria bacterium GW2011_GWA2_47_7]